MTKEKSQEQIRQMILDEGLSPVVSCERCEYSLLYNDGQNCINCGKQIPLLEPFSCEIEDFEANRLRKFSMETS